MQNKKYYSITEVGEILKIPPHRLRYLESKLSHLVISKIKNRRYYTKENIEYIKNHVESISNIIFDEKEQDAITIVKPADSSKVKQKELYNFEKEKDLFLYTQSITAIDKLIANFQKLSVSIQELFAG